MRPTTLTVCRGILRHDDVREYIAAKYPGLIAQMGVAVADCAALDQEGMKDALKYLQGRLRAMDGKYYDLWGKWTNRDYCAVSRLLDFVAAQLGEE